MRSVQARVRRSAVATSTRCAGETKTGLTRVRTAAPTRSPRSSSGDQAPRRSGGIANSPDSRDLATPMVGACRAASRGGTPSRSAGGGRGPGQRQAADPGCRRVPSALRAPPGFRETTAGPARTKMRSAGAPARTRPPADPRTSGPQPRQRVMRHGPRTRRRYRRSRRARPTDRVHRPHPTGGPGEHALRRCQIPGPRMDRRQRHGRRSPASLMTRTVSDHRPSDSTSATLNQRASAASLPGRSAALGASATKSIRV